MDGTLTPRASAFRLAVVVALGVLAVGLLYTWPPLPQPLAYHNFADQRTLWNIPHALNVLSNVPFLVVTVAGLRFLFRRDTLRPGGPFLTAAERWPFVAFFAGVGLAGLGSAYYHLEPDNARLFWDRLPMAVAFMGLSAAVLAERIGPRVGVGLLGPLVVLGVASTVYWRWTEEQGRGDLRFYYVVQFYPMLALPLLLMLFPPRYTRTLDLVIALGWYVVAKVCEHPLDEPIFALGHWVSGHTLKHLAAALAAYWVLRMLRARRPLAASRPS